jgi:hypothetical protein
MDNAKVTRVPHNVSPQSALKTVVHSQDSLIGHNLPDHVYHAVVFTGGSLVLETNLDKLEGYDDERFGCTSGGTSKDGESLRLLSYAEGLTVDFAPFVVGGEFRSSAEILSYGPCICIY